MKRLLVTGGSSFLGYRLLEQLPREQAAAICYWRNRPETEIPAWSVDMRDRAGVVGLIKRWRPEVIIHLAGSNRGESMEEVIVAGTRHVVEGCREVGARLIFMSTDVIFDGREGPYDESGVGRPLHGYGRAKVAAEGIVGGYDEGVIVRTSLIYDVERRDHGTQWIERALRAGEEVTLFTNQWRNPIEASSLAAACLELAESNYRGVLNVAGEQEMTRAVYAQKLLAWFEVAERDKVVLGEADGGRWPLDTRLDISRAKEVLATPLLGVDAVLAAARG
ncbi:MAG TPA: sugar nucleotide-binding protein [Anaerolineae bacterium]|nr:sugar nucleotide-binding protein [Anaerolineae bacterium]